jgi:hypothetical protein
VLYGLDGPSAHEFLSYIIPLCPHQQAKAWLLDIARRRILLDLDKLIAQHQSKEEKMHEEHEGEGSSSSSSESESNYHFLGDKNLESYLFTPLATCAADTMPSSLSDNLDVYLAVLTTCRLVLLRRQALLNDIADKICSTKSVEQIKRAVAKIAKTLQGALSTQTKPLKEAADMTEDMVPEAAVVTARTVYGEPIALSPTPSASSFHLELLSEATRYISEILEPHK